MELTHEQTHAIQCSFRTEQVRRDVSNATAISICLSRHKIAASPESKIDKKVHYRNICLCVLRMFVLYLQPFLAVSGERMQIWRLCM
jgi:hypothetical protein